MRWGAVLGTLAGVALAAWLLASYGVREIVDLLGRAGWGIVAVVLFHWTQILFSALAWRVISKPLQPQPSLGEFVALRWIRESVNSMLPVAHIGGGIVAARLLRRRGYRLVSAVAGSIGDITMESLTQILFTLVGLGLLVLLVGESGIAGYVLGGTVVAVVGATGLVAGQWFGMAGALDRAFMRLSRYFGWTPPREISGLDESLRTLYRAPGPLMRACFHHSVSWLLGGVEVCLALHLLGHSVGFAEGMVIESLGQALRAVGFAVPGAIGVAEGGYVVVCHLFGVAPEIAIALSLMKRLREVALGVPGLVAWQLLERRPARGVEKAA
jgi:putative membrane protein